MKKMYSFLLSLTVCLLLSSMSWATDYFVDASRPDDTGDGLSLATAKKTIQAGVNVASAGDVVIVAAGTYPENVTINKALTLRSSAGKATTIITGSTGLGTVLIQANNVTVGGFGQGFTINGYDSPSPALEYAAVYVQGVRSNVTIRGNEIVANGEGGLITEFSNAVTNFVVNLNVFSGKTFVGAEAGDCGFANQFTAPNVPRQLVVIPTGTGVTFTSNNITGIAGSASTNPSCTAFGQGNTLVTIDANNATIRGNTFAGTTTRFGSSLRVRGTGANIACNTFDNTGLGAACVHLVLNGTSLPALGSPNSLAGIAAQNTFTNEGAYFTGAMQIYRDAAQVSAIPQTPIAANTIQFANITNVNTGEKFCSIQSAIDDINTINGHTISVAAGTYNEDVVVNKSLTINGAGIDVTTVVGPIGGGGSTFQVAASGVVINGFTITRAGNNPTDWNGALNTAGVAIQSQGNFAEIKNCKIIGNRNGIDVNNSNGNNIHNNIITDNRTGLIFRNQTDNTILVQNEITNNWTLGVLFLDASSGTNTPIQTAANSTFNDNNISGNWYGGVVDRQTGGALPAPGANLKNFNCNWYGSTSPVVTTANSAEPGYAAQIPVAYGGMATNPGGSPDIAGPASANIMYVPFLTDGTDNDGATAGFQPVPNSCAGTTLSFTATSPRGTVNITNASGAATFDIYMCEGESFTGSNVVTSGPNVRVTETITTASTMSAGNSGVTYNNVAVPAPRASSDQPSSFFNASYGPYGINTAVAPTSPVETLTQTFQPYTDGAGGGTVNGAYDGETYGPTITVVYHVSRKPSLTTTVNGEELTNDDDETEGGFTVCSSTSPNVTVTQFVEDNGLTGSALRVYQTVTTTNATFSLCNNCSIAFSGLATPFSGTATLIDPSMAGEVVLKWRAFVDANGNGEFDEPLECAADWIEYTITVNPTPILVITNPSPVCTPQTVDITAPAVTAGSTLPSGTTLSYFKDAAATMPLDMTSGPATAIVLSGTYYIVASAPNSCSDTAAVEVVIKPTPITTLVASKYDVCPNTEVTLTPTCSVLGSTIQWSASHPTSPAGPTVTPNAPDISFVYKATCVADGCVGTTDSVVVRTHRILVSLMNVGTMTQPTALVGPVTVASANLAPTWQQNTFSVASSPRKWNLIATGCSDSESAVFEFTGGPFAGFKSVDNNAPYAVFANVGATYFAQDHPNYGNGVANFPDGTYYLKVDLRSADGVGGPFPKNRMATGGLLATRTLSFKIQSSVPTREGVSESLTSSDEENWASIFTNPVSNEVVLRLSGKAGETVQLNMVNLQGQLVHQSGVTMESVSQYATINVSNFATGFYILKAVKGDKIKTIKVLKVQ